jgi:hypothetical protein
MHTQPMAGNRTKVTSESLQQKLFDIKNKLQQEQDDD